uniref:Methyltransferase domain-containing protein n=1 Tax=Ditylenchus dipsaci TaxID=166011 RepID=A0A915EE87_9BILA
MLSNPYSAVLKQFGWLADLYTVDFFVEHHWEKLPKAWQVYFEKCLQLSDQPKCTSQQFQQQIELIQHILSDNPTSDTTTFNKVGPAPFSFLALKECVKQLSYSYEAVKDKRQLCKKLNFNENVVGDQNNFTNLLDQPVKLRSKLKPKKLHEVGRLCDLIDVLLAHHKCKFGEDIKHVVDIGAGIGHLSRMFSLVKNLDVTTIEGNSEFVEKSKILDQMFMAKVASKEWKAPNRQEAYIKHTQHIDSLTKGDNHQQTAHVVVGLHSCGDLSPTILRYFVHNINAKVLISIGCCYHKLNGGTDKPFMQDYGGKEKELAEPINISGYPMSSSMFKDVQLSYASREIASFSKDRFLEILISDQSLKVLSIHSYRAALEYLILGCPETSQLSQLNQKLRHQGLPKVKNATTMEFSEYMTQALRNQPDVLKRIENSDNANLSQVMSLLEKDGIKVVIMIALRLILAPLIEAIVLQDRIEFLKENALMCYAVPLFKPNVSPRNIVLISFK